jgi:NAD(P)-dependent dehydrogenase (short-subunit alcohol dehydrogenase family)
VKTTDLTGRTIVVTGGSRGIGRATAELLLERGAEVVLIARGSEPPDSALLAAGVAWFEADVTDERAVGAAFAAIDKRHGWIDGLFANAGIGLAEGPLHALAPDSWNQIISTDLHGTYIPVRETLRRMVAGDRGGSIVCTTSVVVQAAIAGAGSAYHAAKGAVEAMVRSVAVDYGRHGIRCNALSPGATETGLMWVNVPDEQIPAIRAAVEASVPLGRLADPAEVAEAAVWLLSDTSSYVTGMTLLVDGGVTAKSVLPA